MESPMDDVRTLPSGHARPMDRVAPDLSRFRRSRARYGHPAEEQAEARQAARARQTRQTRRARGMRLSVTGMLLFAMAFASVLFIVYTSMQLSELSKDTSKLQRELTALRQENARMQAQADKHLNLSELARAAEEMGMVLPGSEDIIYLDLSGSDHAIVTEKPGVWDALINSLASLAAKVHEYFS
jgi:cell division protein FtsL